MLRPRNGESHASVILPTLGRNMLRPYKWFCVLIYYENDITVLPFVEALKNLRQMLSHQTQLEASD